ncbi:MAG TPA: glycosyltransferase family 4 protein [Phycisphaerales bacterium]|nr:glycosyltransferase family 4 protein [Phycisphaerales bacterium]
MPRILHISTRLILGGSQENTVLSCEGQARLGHDVHLAFGPIYGPEGSLLDRVQNFRTADNRGITTHVIPDMVREVAPLRERRALAQLTRLIREIKPDVVHTHSSKAGILGRIAAWRLLPDLPQMRVIHTIHGPPFMPVEGSPLNRAKVAINNTIYTLAERIAARHCHTIVSVADAMTQQFLARGIGNPSQYITIRSGMEIAPFLAARELDQLAIRRELGLAPDDFVIGTVARLAQHKGHDDLIDALADELRTRPHWKLLWVGDGWWRDRLEARLTSLNLRDRVILTGLVPPQRVPALMRAMDVLAHPSYREGLPRTVPQALLAGALPVAYDVDGTGEICRDMQTGRLVPLAHIAKLCEAIVWAHEHPDERAAMIRRGQAECERDFSAERMVERLEQVYFQTSG